MSEAYYDRRQREKAEAAAVEKRKAERAAHYKAQLLPEIWKAQATNSVAQQTEARQWQAWFAAHFHHFERSGGMEGWFKAIGHGLADMKRETKREVLDIYDPKIKALQAENAELKDRVTKLEQPLTVPEAFEQRLALFVERRLNEHLERTVGHKDADFEVTTHYVDAQIDRAVALKLAEIEQRFVSLVEQRFSQHIARTAERKDADLQATARYVGEQIEEPLNRFILEEVRRAVKKELPTMLEALEQRPVPQAEQRANNQRWAAIDQRIKHLEQEIDGRLGPNALHETQCAGESKLESKLEALEQRLKSVPGKLPVAKTWHPESVTYQSEFVSHDGALWQAHKDTAQTPGGSDWICAARAGRDAITPTVRGTYSVDKNYKLLDIVAMDGGAFIACKDNPGVCPGDGWQMIARRGKPGRPGATGPKGPQGEKGEPGKDGATTVSWQLDRAKYRMSPLMSNGTVGPNQEFRGMFEQFLIDFGFY